MVLPEKTGALNDTGSKSFGVTELWQQLGGLIINCCYCRETSIYCNYLGFLFFQWGWAGELYLFSELEKEMKPLAKFCFIGNEYVAGQELVSGFIMTIDAH